MIKGAGLSHRGLGIASQFIFLFIVLFLAIQSEVSRGADSLSSWNDNNTKQAITAFVDKVTSNGSADYVPPADRVAVFDGDGTLWPEKPLPFQLYFTIDRIRELASDNAHWRNKEPMASILKDDFKGILAGGKRASMELVAASHWGKSTDEFNELVGDWVSSAVHPVTQLPFTEMVYQPMLELVAYLRSHSFKIYIITEDSVEFTRPLVAQTYGISPQQVIGSNAKAEFQMRDGEVALIRLKDLNIVGDKKDKPLALFQHIGQRPIAAFGNSDGDLAMLHWATSGAGVRFGLLVHHTDSEREWAYDRDSSVGLLDRGLTAAERQGWTVVDMKRDWKTVYLENAVKR